MRALMTERAPQEEAGEALLALLEEHLRPPAGSELSGKRRSLSLDKAWHGVHYLLTGAVEPDGTLLGQAVLGGTEVGEDFTGYGPARLFEPDVVAALATALADPCVEEEANGRSTRRGWRSSRSIRSAGTRTAWTWLLSRFASCVRSTRRLRPRASRSRPASNSGPPVCPRTRLHWPWMDVAERLARLEQLAGEAPVARAAVLPKAARRSSSASVMRTPT